MLREGNPIIRHTFTADPTVLVHDGAAYLYTGHDEPPKGQEVYNMQRWLCFSSTDLLEWHEHPSPLQAKDFKWADGDAFASKVIEHNNRFYWFVSVSNGTGFGKAIGVAVADNPAGPFTDAIGAPLVTHAMLPKTENEKANLDPTVLVDDDGRAYLIWGNGQCYFAELRSDLLQLNGPVSTIDLPHFAEGAHIHKRGKYYYLAYGYGYPEKVAYAMSESIFGPWEWKGILNEIAGNCATNRPAILDFKGRSYFFYHNGALPNGGSHRRSVCIDFLHYEEDGTMRRVVMSTEGILPPVSSKT
ncbi:glycoside hydrolase family 43 protein [Dyadobacter sp. MSC1_007]|jgi:hypothetical protein|uniref:glycoside hydrolase family 43 protein n=1 Tax=Dyadobacter sp. MSC1_007 TaxID=2909264 RepID=UPI00202E825E|nr:glycoside hydrolase family 43 protein [Dyadobacter sp. MSC1_007]